LKIDLWKKVVSGGAWGKKRKNSVLSHFNLVQLPFWIQAVLARTVGYFLIYPKVLDNVEPR
jgi:hypothetical protein